MSSYTIACPCLFGLESVLSGEVKRMGGQDVQVTDGRVTFKGDQHMVARANIMLRTAERVLIVMGMFRAESFTELFDGVYALPLEDYIGKYDAFPVKGWSISSKLKSIPDCQKIIKKAMAKRLGEHYGLNRMPETGDLVQVRFSIHKDMVSVMLDTSGLPLHKRGYRAHSNLAPIKETLAAGIADIAHIKPGTQVYDPFCGSGTILIESAMKALKVPPGLRRRFAAEKWGSMPEEVWREERERGFELIVRDGEFMAHGSDIDPECVKLTQENCRKASVASKITCDLADIKDFKVPDGNFVLVCNPPYGERMLDIQNAEKLYRIMGEVFEPGEGRSYCIISPHENFERLFGREASRRRKLYNGMLKCQLFMFY